MTPTAPPTPKKTAPPASPGNSGAGGAPAAPAAPTAPATPGAPAPQPPLPEPEYVPVGEETKPAAVPAPGEAWASYTQAELDEAAGEIAVIKPQELLYLRDRVNTAEKSLGENNPLGEAGGVAWLDLFSRSGAKISLTSRALNPTDALVNLVNAVKFAGATWDFHPLANQPRQQGAPAAQQAKQAPPQSGTGRQVAESGTDILHSIEVEDPKKDKASVKFQVGKFKYPMSDARIRQENGAQTICDLFDKELQWLPDHFIGPVYYSEEQLNGLKADWEKIEKDGKTYYNVIRIHA